MKNKLLIIIVCIVLLIFFFFIITFKKENTIDNTNYEENAISENMSDDNVYLVHTYVTDEVILNSDNITCYVDLLQEYTPSYTLQICDAVIIGTVISIDGASMEYSTFGMTYGTMGVNNVIYGQLNDKKIINFMKPGGYVTVADYDAHDTQIAVEKRDYLREQAGVTIDKENSYINIEIENDVTIEAGKTYLVYIKYMQKYDKYEIIGLRCGLREINIDKQSLVTIKELDIDNLQLKNNVTQDWEPLEEYIDENIK